jgi:Domain of unknown function (DUF4259)
LESRSSDSDYACEAIAAAAVVAARLPGAAPLPPPNAPEIGLLDISADISGLALRALDRIAGDDSEWRSLWEYSHEQALAPQEPVRAVIAR